ncbi:hypothetical protein KP509_07G090700 [Ceratopteris richardii]|uniref:Pentatricopeptide repeat-containing protein-mitochondrial domain-containing protein n=1 Tax=Ceratopteris richardii TaxID=49495 RepID=A0A8T2UGW4_CERRI|nr:hypothetical protein KP509_07G090700 [Ceratopteris richardii]
MSNFRSFIKLLCETEIRIKGLGKAHTGCFRHAAYGTSLNSNAAVDFPFTPRVNQGLLNGYGSLQCRGLHGTLQACQMSQPETEEQATSPEASSQATVQNSTEVDTIDNASAREKQAEATQGVLAPVVPGMPVVHRGAQAPRAVVGQSLTIHGLIREMTDRIHRRLFEEAIQIYKEWLQCIDPLTGKPNKPLVPPCNIALLAEGLKGAPVDILLKRVEEMRRLGLNPNTDTFYVLFNAAADAKDLAALDRLFKIVQDLEIPVQTEWCIKAIASLRSDADVWKAMDYVRIMVINNLSPDDLTLSKLVSAFSRIGQAQKATDLVRWGQKREAYPTMNSLGDLLQACVESDVPEGALLALELLFGRRKGRPARSTSLDEGTLLAVLSLAARTGDLALSSKAWDVLMLSLRQTHPPSEACFLARLHAATTAGDLDLAISTLHMMEKEYISAINSEVFSPFTSLRPFVLGVARAGTATLDASYFKLEALASSNAAPLSAINCVILGCANVWDIDRAYQTFEAIRSVYGLMPNVHSCNALIEGFAKMRKVAETMKVYEFMGGSGIEPDQRTFDLLVKAHIVNRDPKSALETVNQMVDAGFSLHKDMAFKLRRRFIRECDDEGARSVLDFKQKFRYADGFTGDARRALIFPYAIDNSGATRASA